MILVDTGPIVALFDPKDPDHGRCRSTLEGIRQPLVTTVPVLTETFHIFSPESHGARVVREFVTRGGLTLWFLTEASLHRAFALMTKYADHPMGLADASLVAAAEDLRITDVFSLDRADFATYRVRIGRSYKAFRMIPDGK